MRRIPSSVKNSASNSSQSKHKHMSMSREYPDRPIAGIGAVVLRYNGDRAEVLLVRRAHEPMAGSWSLPGGAIELGETARDACAREVFEKTSLTVVPMEEVETSDVILRDATGRTKYHYLIVDLLCHVESGELCARSDACETIWANARAVLELGDFGLTPRACTVIRKALVMDEGR
jgi:8-oxo-dGTP diphosphatase